jgi:carbamoyltransferase
MNFILGISAYYHDSAAALIKDGKIIAAAQEERFTRKKHDSSFPYHAIKYCLSLENIKISDLDYIVFYDKPLLKFERLLETYLAYAPKGITSFIKAMPVWLKEKLYLKATLKQEFADLGACKKERLPQLLFTEHHQSHAASAFYPSQFNEAAVLCLDGVGEWATSSVWYGKGNSLTPKWQIDFPHSLGLLYSAFTYYTGFKVNSGEYKLMGLAPYGKPIYVDLILENLIDLKEDGTFQLNMKYFNYATGLTMTSSLFNDLFQASPRSPESPVTMKEMDLAASIQYVTEEIVLRLSKTALKELDTDYMCLAGGVALNCVANGRLLKENICKEIWVQPASGDAGGAIGSALSVYFEYMGNNRKVENIDGMSGSYLGPEYKNDDIKLYLDETNAHYISLSDSELFTYIAKLIAEGNVIGWFQGRMEFGPRALGNRSIIGDPRNEKMQSIMNLKIKYRESFRPFAPSVLDEYVSDYFDLEQSSPYMMFVADVKKERRIAINGDNQKLTGIDKLKQTRSDIPSVTHVDYSARIQTVHEKTNPRYYKLINEFYKQTGYALLINTSFNVRGEPIVCTPEDAYRCFMNTEMDYLVMENIVLSKSEQPDTNIDKNWLNKFELD